MRSPTRLLSRPACRVFALGCCTDALGAPVQDFMVTILGTTVPASQVFSDSFLNARTPTSVQNLAAGLLSGSAGVAPVLNDDGSVTVKGLKVIPPGGAKIDALEAVLVAAGRIPAAIPVGTGPANILTQKPASWWTAVAKENTTDAALVRLENDLRANLVAVTQTGAVVGGGRQASTGMVPVYVTLQPSGAVNVAAYQATGGRIFAQTAPSTLTPVVGGTSPGLTAGTTAPLSTNFFSNLINNTLTQAANVGQSSLLQKLLPPPPVAPSAPGGFNLPALPAAPTTAAPGFSGNLGVGFSLPPPPLAPVAPTAPGLSYGGQIPPLVATPSLPAGGNIVTPPSLPSTLSTAPVPPALPVFPGVPSTTATGDGLGLSGSGFITGLPTVPAAPALPVAAMPWAKYGLIALGVVAAGAAVWAIARRPAAPVYRRRRRYA